MVSVLEGGYSDRALTSATLAHVTGLAASGSSPPPMTADHPTWWELRHLVALEKACKLKARKLAANGSTDEAWLAAAVDHFRRLEPSAPPANTTPLAQSLAATPAQTGSMTLRARKTRPGESEEASPSSVLSKAKARTVSKAVKGSAGPTPRPKPPATETPAMPGGYATSASGSAGEAFTSDESRQASATPPPSDLSEATAASSDIAVPGGLPKSGIKFVWRAGGFQ